MNDPQEITVEEGSTNVYAPAGNVQSISNASSCGASTRQFARTDRFGEPT